MSGFRLVAYLYRCTVCGIEYQVQAGERTLLACNHPSALDVLDNIDAPPNHKSSRFDIPWDVQNPLTCGKP